MDWDSTVFSFPVLNLVEHKQDGITPELAQVWKSELSALAEQNRFMLTARVEANEIQLRSTLQNLELQAIEWTLHPRIDLHKTTRAYSRLIDSRRATDAEIAQIANEAGKAFQISRYHRDTRIDPRLADQRFENWIRTSTSDPTKELTVFLDPASGEPVAFFLHRRDGDNVFLELTAVFEKFRGLGFSQRVWETFLADQLAKNVGAVTTNISAENSAVIGIYPKLGFSFSDSSVVYHGHFGAVASKL